MHVRTAQVQMRLSILHSLVSSVQFEHYKQRTLKQEYACAHALKYALCIWFMFEDKFSHDRAERNLSLFYISGHFGWLVVLGLTAL